MPTKGKKRVTPDYQRECVVCDFGNFVGDMPVSGECRRSPPRSFLEGRDGNPSRFFPIVRYYDWCGQYRPSSNGAQAEDNLSKLASIRSGPEKINIADTLKRSGKVNDALALYESVFQTDNTNAELAFKISVIYWNQSSAGAEGHSAQKALEWQKQATELGHSEAPYLVGLHYAQGNIVEKNIEEANRYLQISSERGLQRAINKQDEGGFE